MFKKTKLTFICLLLSSAVWLFSILSNRIGIMTAITCLSILAAALFSIFMRYQRRQRNTALKIEECREAINLIQSELNTQKKQLENIPEQTGKLNLFKTLTEEVSQIQEPYEIYAFINQKMKLIFPNLDLSMIYIIKQNKLSLVSSYKQNDSIVIKDKQGDILDYWVIKHNQPLIIEDISREFRFDLEQISSLKNRVINSLIISPISLGKRILGSMRIESKEKLNFNFEDLRMLSVIAGIAAVSIDRSEIFQKVQELAIKDSLTGLYLRSYFNERLEKEIKRAFMNSCPIGVILADIDHFKRINDKYGHVVGDLVIKQLSRILKQSVGDSGNIVARFGGEEFIAFLISSSKEETVKVAESIRERIASNPVVFRRNKISFTASLGVAAFPEDAKYLEELIRKTDTALYKAKKSGRNKVCSA